MLPALQQLVLSNTYIPLTKKQFVLTYRYTVLLRQNNLTDPQQTNNLCFYENIGTSNFSVDTAF